MMDTKDWIIVALAVLLVLQHLLTWSCLKLNTKILRSNNTLIGKLHDWEKWSADALSLIEKLQKALNEQSQPSGTQDPSGSHSKVSTCETVEDTHR
jgi:hypothetical protein